MAKKKKKKKKKKKTAKKVEKKRIRTPVVRRGAPRSASRSVSYRAAGEAPPKFIVLFKEPDAKLAVQALTKHVKELSGTTEPAKTAAMRIMPKSSGRSPVSLYAQVGVAAMDMSDEERKELAGDERVSGVFRNEQRHIAPFRPVSGQPQFERTGSVSVRGRTLGPAQTFGDTDGPGQTFGETPGPGQTFGHQPGLVPYLRGYRDGVTDLVGRFEAKVPAEQPIGEAAQAQFAQMTWGLQRIGVRADGSGPSGQGIAVAVLDTGLDFNHPDFAGRVSANQRQGFGPNPNAQDGHGHGTHVAGTVAGPLSPADNAMRYGVAPNVDLFIGKVLDDAGSGWDSDIVEGIEWAASNDVRVINLSLGSPRNADEPYSGLYEEIAGRLACRRGGALIVAAAGNESQRQANHIAPVGNPAACPSIMSVAAFDSNNNIADFSCGKMDRIGAVDISAPGVDVFSSIPGGGYARWPGTSMACPHVSGIAALYLEKHPELTPYELRNLVTTNAGLLSYTAWDAGAGMGQVPG